MGTIRPRTAAFEPSVLELQPGVYWWCRCGESRSQPFCDGSHKKQGVFSPILLEIDSPTRVELCQCKQTGTPPFCDNTHKSLR